MVTGYDASPPRPSRGWRAELDRYVRLEYGDGRADWLIAEVRGAAQDSMRRELHGLSEAATGAHPTLVDVVRKAFARRPSI